MKNIQNPPPRVGPRKYTKYRKNTKMAQKLPFWVFFRFFLCIFGGHPGVGDFVFFFFFVIFSHFWDSGVLGSVPPPQDRDCSEFNSLAVPNSVSIVFLARDPEGLGCIARCGELTPRFFIIT